MSNVSQSTPEDSPDEFLPKSFIIFCLDDDDNVAFEVSWGQEIEDIKKFAYLLHKVKSGDFDQMILEQLKLQSKDIQGGSKKYAAFLKSYNELDSPLSLVVDPTKVELNS
jgi:hypothetical protein